MLSLRRENVRMYRLSGVKAKHKVREVGGILKMLYWGLEEKKWLSDITYPTEETVPCKSKKRC